MVPAILIGCITGAISFSLLTLLVHWLCWPSMLLDGQYGMVFMVTLPFGAILGATSALAMVLSADHKISAGWVAIGGGAPIAALSLLATLLLSKGKIGKEFFATLLFYFGLSLLWAGGLIIRGMLLLKGRF